MSLKQNDKLIICLLYTFVFLICTAVPIQTSGKESSRKQILLVTSYFPDRENSKIIINSFSQKLNAELECRITLEYMDSETTIDFKEWKQWMIQLFEAYKNPPDAVVIIGSEAWATYTATCPQEWKSVPVILGGVKYKHIDYAHISPQNIKGIKELRPTTESFGDFRVTGYYLQDYFRKNMELIRQMQPKTSRIAFIYDNRYGFNFMTPYLKNLAKEIGFEDLDTFYGNELTTMQLADSLMSRDQSCAILSAGWHTDALHYQHSYAMLHNELSLIYSKYFYLIMDQGKNNPNHLGGYYVSGQDIGQDLAKLTRQVITQGIENSP